MKILYLIHSTANTGAAISFMNMVMGLKNKGIEMAVVGPKPQEDFLDVLSKHEIPYYSINIAESVYPSILTGGIKDHFLYVLRIVNLIRRKNICYKDILKIAKIYHPDIIHTNVGTLHEGYRVAKKLHIPHVWHIREYQDKDFGWRFFPSKAKYEQKLRNSHVIAITKDLISYFDLNEYGSAHVIYNGIFNKSNRCFIWPKEKYFLCASRISWEKGIDEVIAAFANFYRKNKDYRLVVLGDGDSNYIEKLKGMSKESSCSDAIQWEGYKNNVFEYMKKATCLIVASHHEAFGRMTAEACFAGCIVLGRNTGGTQEILENTGGFLFETGEDLLRGMVNTSELLEEDYREIALKAQNKAVNTYSIEANIDAVYQTYISITSRST